MACGFGAAALLFLVIKHQANTSIAQAETDHYLLAEVRQLEREISAGRASLTHLVKQVAALDRDLLDAQVRARRIEQDMRDKETRFDAPQEEKQLVQRLQAKLRDLNARRDRVRAEIEQAGRQVRSFLGEGQRQYLTGLKLGGKRILVLLDASASMLDERIVNVIRRRNMSDERKRRAPKWQQALATVDWLSAQFPRGSQYQIYTFSTQARPVLPDSAGQWLRVSDLEQLDHAIIEMRKVIPVGGTSLEAVFIAVERLTPEPDNIVVITDGLPTQGARKPSATTVSGRKRLELFEKAIKRLPPGIPVNVILQPMEGDPMAAAAWWQLALETQGSFLTPSADWP